MATKKRDGFYRRGKYLWARDPVDGQRKSTRCTSVEAARLWRAARERIRADPAHHAAQTSRLGDWIGRWLKSKQGKVSEATMLIANQKLGHFGRIFGADMPLSEITPGALDSYVAQRRTEDVVDLTIAKEWTHLRAVLLLAKRGGCFPADVDTLKPPDLKATYEPRKRALTRSELGALRTQLRADRWAAVATCVALGLRWSEAMGLLPSDFEADRVHIRGTKTAGSRRTVPILSLFRPLLLEARPFIPLNRWTNVRHELIEACARAGIAPCTPNDLRRTFSTMLSEAGVDRDTIRRFLGHTTTAMVDRVYGQPKTEALAGLAEARLAGTEKILDGLELNAEALVATGVDAGGEVATSRRTLRRPSAAYDNAAGDAQPKPLQISTATRRFRAMAWLWFTREAA